MNQNAGLPRFACFPFGGGARKRIGASFAQMESVLMLATIARRLRFELAADAQVEILPSLTLPHLFGLRMAPHKRGGPVSL